MSYLTCAWWEWLKHPGIPKNPSVFQNALWNNTKNVIDSNDKNFTITRFSDIQVSVDQFWFIYLLQHAIPFSWSSLAHFINNEHLKSVKDTQEPFIYFYSSQKQSKTSLMAYKWQDLPQDIQAQTDLLWN